MHVAVFKNVFDKGTRTIRQTRNSHDLRLHIGRETWMRLSTDINRLRATFHLRTNPTITSGNNGTHIFEFF